MAMRGTSDSAIACLAMVADISYVEAARLMYEGRPYRPASQSCVLAALGRAGVPASSNMRKVYGWDGIPQPAIVRTLLDPSDTYWHWVVRAQGLVFDPGLVAPIKPEHCWRPPLSFISFQREFAPA